MSKLNQLSKATADYPCTELAKDLTRIDNKQKENNGPMYICGDWNARLIYPTSTEEEEIKGKHTMHEDDSVMELFTAGMNDSRKIIIELAKQRNLIAMNTRLRKRLEKC